MQIHLEDSASLLHGAIRHELDETGLLPWRFTAAQVDHFTAGDPNWAIRCRVPAGISLALRTDSETITLEWQVQGLARNWLGIDCAVAGQPLLRSAAGLVAEGERWRGHFELADCPRRSDGTRAVQIWLPHTVGGRLTSLHLDQGSSWQPIDPPSKRLVCIGDSITQGMIAEGSGTTLAAGLARALDADLLNQGVGGHVFDPASFDPAIPGDARLVTVAYGTNDWSGDLDRATITSRAREHCVRIRERWPDTPILVILPLWRQSHATNKAAGNLRECNRGLRDAFAELDDVEVLDGFACVPHDEARLPDGVHPNEAGFLHYTNAVRQAVRDRGLWPG